MKYFIIGFASAIITMFINSCSVTPLEAHSSELGSSEWNPLYVYCTNCD